MFTTSLSLTNLPTDHGKAPDGSVLVRPEGTNITLREMSRNTPKIVDRILEIVEVFR